MGSSTTTTTTTSIALFLSLNLLLSAIVTADLLPGLPSLPPTTGLIPGIPEIPGVPGTPGMPAVPGVPGTSVPSAIGKCPKDLLKLGVCANVLNLVKNVVVGAPPTLPCCALLEGLVDLEVALCLCTAIKANILGLNLNVPLALSLVVNNCGKTLPNGFECT